MGYFWQNEKIKLRLSKKSDWIYFYESCKDSETRFMFYTESELPFDREVCRKKFADFLKSAKKKGRVDLTVINCEGDVVGSIDLYDVDHRAGTFQIATYIMPRHAGKGYGEAALSLMLEYCFFEMRLHKYNARIIKENEKSIRLHEKLGARLEGVLSDMFYHRGRYYDLLWYGLTKEEFEKQKAKEEKDKCN